MRRSILISSLLLLALPIAVVAQPPAASEDTAPGLDPVSRQATQLEGELGKYKDSTPEAADVMLKLVDLYHSNGRVFGLVRVARQFSSSQTSHAQHAAVMLKLMDGLEALSRNDDLTAICRQFLARYPQAKECPAVEIRLADTTLQVPKDRIGAANAARAVWNRQGNSIVGREYAARAISIYASIGNGETITTAAKLAEEVLDKLPAGPFTRRVGRRSFDEWRRINKWAKANIVGNKMLKREC